MSRHPKEPKSCLSAHINTTKYALNYTVLLLNCWYIIFSGLGRYWLRENIKVKAKLAKTESREQQCCPTSALYIPSLPWQLMVLFLVISPATCPPHLQSNATAGALSLPPTIILALHPLAPHLASMSAGRLAVWPHRLLLQQPFKPIGHFSSIIRRSSSECCPVIQWRVFLLRTWPASPLALSARNYCQGFLCFECRNRNGPPRHGQN